MMKAYSVDLREKIVAAVRRGMSRAQAARTFGVGATSVKRYVKLAEEGKPLAPGKAPGKQSKLGEAGMRLLEEDLRARPTVSYRQRAEYLFKLLGVKVREPTICRAIKRRGCTRKKVGASERDERLRADRRVMVAEKIDPKWLVFVDEMGTNVSLPPLVPLRP